MHNIRRKAGIWGNARWVFAMNVLDTLAVLFAFTIGILVLVALVIFVLDRLQTEDAIRRNYPVIGRFRHLFSTLGEFFRQYFFAMDREELPFNRAQREWVKRAGEGKGNTVAFGSTRSLNVIGTPIFANAVFPPLDDQFASSEPFGHRTRHAHTLPCSQFFQRVGHELWRDFKTCSASVKPRCERGEHLAKYG